MWKILTSHPAIPGPSGPFLPPVSNPLAIISAPGCPAMTLEFYPAADSPFPGQALSFTSHCTSLWFSSEQWG